jgi:hypothetical protein
VARRRGLEERLGAFAVLLQQPEAAVVLAPFERGDDSLVLG